MTLQEYKDNLNKKLQLASDEMLASLKMDTLTDNEKYEWYGYIRAIRDIAFDSGLLNETTTGDNLHQSLKIILNQNA